MAAVIKLRQVINSLPTKNQVIIKYLCGFLVSVSILGNVNKMTCANLAIVFGPNLLYPQQESLEAILRIPKINSVVQFLLERYLEIFSE